MKNYLILAMLLSIILPVFAEDTPRYIVSDLKAMGPGKTIELMSKNNTVSFQTADGKRKQVQVSLEITSYEVKRKDTESGEENLMTTHYYHELKSSDKDIPYNWGFWHFMPCCRFSLFTTTSGENYLTWVTTGFVSFAEVSKPREKSAPIVDFSGGHIEKPAIPSLVPVRTLTTRYEGKSAFMPSAICDDINMLSFGKDAKGNYTLEVSGIDPNEVYKIVSDSEAEDSWRLDSVTKTSDKPAESNESN